MMVIVLLDTEWYWYTVWLDMMIDRIKILRDVIWNLKIQEVRM